MNPAKNLTYDQWIETNPESYASYEISFTCDRDCYELPNGVYIYDHFRSSMNFFTINRNFVVVDLTLEMNEKNISLVEKYGGEISEGWGYCDNGYGLPIFTQKIEGTSIFDKKMIESDTDYLKRAFDFINEFVLLNQ